MMKHLRWLIAEKLLYWALCIAPEGDGKADLADDLGAFMRRQIERGMPS